MRRQARPDILLGLISDNNNDRTVIIVECDRSSLLRVALYRRPSVLPDEPRELNKAALLKRSEALTRGKRFVR